MGPTYDRVQPSIAEICAPIRAEMQRTDAFVVRTLQSKSPYIETLCRHIERFKGKRLRPALVHLAARAVGATGDADAAALRCEVAGIIELIHLTTLVHDDIIDEASIRRRVPTVNSEWSNETAVMLGDYLFASAFKVLTRMRDLRPLDILAPTTRLMCEGELLQISHCGNVEITEPEYLDVIGKKTAELFRASGYLGALLAGAAPEQAEVLGRCGGHIGLAFQIIDDCLDLIGTEREMGKSLGTDLEKGRLTLPAIRWVSELPASRRRRAIAELGLLDGRLDRAKVAARLEASGSIHYAMDRARAEVGRAMAEIAALPDSAARESLALFGDYVVSRAV